MNECDYCWGKFDYPPDAECSEQDYCICNYCIDVCKKQLKLMRESDKNRVVKHITE